MSEDKEAVNYMLERFNEMDIFYDSNTLMKISENDLSKMISLHKGWKKAFFSKANFKVGPGGNKKAKKKREIIKNKENEAKIELDNFLLELSNIIK